MMIERYRTFTAMQLTPRRREEGAEGGRVARKWVSVSLFLLVVHRDVMYAFSSLSRFYRRVKSLSAITDEWRRNGSSNFLSFRPINAGRVRGCD